MGLQLANKLKHPNFEYDKEEVRYSHRFAPFACVSTPPMVPYSQFKVCILKPNEIETNLCKLFCEDLNL
jgi:hypothetical protein